MVRGIVVFPSISLKPEGLVLCVIVSLSYEGIIVIPRVGTSSPVVFKDTVE